MSPRRNFLLTSIKLALRPPDKPKVRIWTDCKANRAYWKDEMEADNEAQLNSYRQPGIKHRASLSIEGRADAGQAVDFQDLIIGPLSSQGSRSDRNANVLNVIVRSRTAANGQPYHRQAIAIYLFIKLCNCVIVLHQPDGRVTNSVMTLSRP